jgi:hypothetical protein
VGWVERSFKGDALGGKRCGNPKDRMLTIECYDELPAVYTKSIFS